MKPVIMVSAGSGCPRHVGISAFSEKTKPALLRPLLLGAANRVGTQFWGEISAPAARAAVGA
jgi:hypothetical protein